jgi:putative FmdB family regulatory protein
MPDTLPDLTAKSKEQRAMPIYEYICNDCETRFEKIVINRQEEIACPKCASKKASFQLSVFATSNGSANGGSAKSSTSFSGGGGSCCGGGCGCN